MKTTATILYRSDRAGLGYAAAIAAVVITAAYPALTRISVTSTLTPADLLLFRLGISGALFAPFLVRSACKVPSDVWRMALPLSFLHGWGMAACVIFGLQFAPASHAAALGPGAIAGWIALIGFVLYGVRTTRRKLFGVSIITFGAALMLTASYGGLSLARALVGDALFLAASALGAIYLVYVQHRRLDPAIAVALVCVVSAMVIVPWHFFFADSSIATAKVDEIVWQALFQGVLVGCCAFFALNYAALTVGSQTVGVLSAIVPIIGAFCSLLAGDPISGIEWAAVCVISAGVALASVPACDAGRSRLRQSVEAFVRPNAR